MSIGKKVEYIVMKYLAVPKKAPEVTPGKIHIACIGDSITFGAGVGGKKEQTWEYFLNKALGEQFEVLNYGISGRTLQKEADYPYEDEKFSRISKEVQADVYILMLGTNDAKYHNWNHARFEREVPEFIKSYMELPNKPRVIVMLPPQCYPMEKTGQVGYEINGKYIDGPMLPIIRKAAEDLGVQVIDLHTFTQNHSEWFDDGVHPNAAGNQAIGEFIYGEL